MRLAPRSVAPAFTVEGVDDSSISLEEFRGRRLWLVLSRYAACPFCSLRLDLLCRRHTEIAEAGVALVVLFPSPVERIRRYALKERPPFRVGSDPEERVYRDYGSETSWKVEIGAALNLPKAVRAVRAAPNNPFAVDGAIHRMPAEFLIDARGRVAKAHYGTQLDDGFPIDDVLEWARSEG